MSLTDITELQRVALRDSAIKSEKATQLFAQNWATPSAAVAASITPVLTALSIALAVAGYGGVPLIVPTGVSFSPAGLTAPVGTQQQLTPTVVPSNSTNKSVTWSSSNLSAWTVSGSGLAIAVGVGTANITCTTVSGGVTSTQSFICQATEAYTALGAPSDIFLFGASLEVNMTSGNNNALMANRFLTKYGITAPDGTKIPFTTIASSGSRQEALKTSWQNTWRALVAARPKPFVHMGTMGNNVTGAVGGTTGTGPAWKNPPTGDADNQLFKTDYEYLVDDIHSITGAVAMQAGCTFRDYGGLQDTPENGAEGYNKYGVLPKAASAVNRMALNGQLRIDQHNVTYNWSKTGGFDAGETIHPNRFGKAAQRNYLMDSWAAAIKGEAPIVVARVKNQAPILGPYRCHAQNGQTSHSDSTALYNSSMYGKAPVTSMQQLALEGYRLNKAAISVPGVGWTASTNTAGGFETGNNTDTLLNDVIKGKFWYTQTTTADTFVILEGGTPGAQFDFKFLSHKTGNNDAFRKVDVSVDGGTTWNTYDAAGENNREGVIRTLRGTYDANGTRAILWRCNVTGSTTSTFGYINAFEVIPV